MLLERPVGACCIFTSCRSTRSDHRRRVNVLILSEQNPRQTLHLVCLISCGVLAASGCASRAEAQAGVTLAAETRSATLNSSVLVDIVYSHVRPRRRVAELAIFWRAEPGWVDRSRADASHDSATSHGTARLGGRHGVVESTQWRGGIRMEYRYDAIRRQINVAGRRLDLDSNNVVIVDRVDSVGGAPRVLLRRADLSPLDEAASSGESEPVIGRPREWVSRTRDLIRRSRDLRWILDS